MSGITSGISSTHNIETAHAPAQIRDGRYEVTGLWWGLYRKGCQAEHGAGDTSYFMRNDNQFKTFLAINFTSKILSHYWYTRCCAVKLFARKILSQFSFHIRLASSRAPLFPLSTMMRFRMKPISG